MTQVHQAVASRENVTRPRWVELYAHGRMWARYNPTMQIIEFARKDVRVVFDLTKYKTGALHKEKTGVE